MKKSHLITGIVYILVGIVFLIAALFTETKIDSLLFGFTGACIGPGILMICKYFYWSSPKNKAIYEEKLEKEQNVLICCRALHNFIFNGSLFCFGFIGYFKKWKYFCFLSGRLHGLSDYRWTSDL